MNWGGGVGGSSGSFLRPLMLGRKHKRKLFIFLSYVAPALDGYANHRIIGWKRPLRSSSPTVDPTSPCLLNHVPKCHICTFFEHLQGWWLHHCHGQPVPMPDHSFSKEICPNIQSKPPLMQLEAIASHPVAIIMWIMLAWLTWKM